MHPKFIDLLRCPRDGSVLELRATTAHSNGSVITGVLVAAGGARYAIEGGVPRFVDSEGYAASFGVEWKRWARTQFEGENRGGAMEGHTARMWRDVLGLEARDLSEKLILEGGCGAGRFLDVARRHAAAVVGIELSAAADVARANFRDDPNVLVVQGDVLRPPLARESFDGAYSIGVLHHTPQPAEGVRALAQCVRRGGWLAVCVYPRGEFYDYQSVTRMRGLHRRLAPLVGDKFALSYSIMAAYVLVPLSRGLRRLHVPRPLVNYIERKWLPILDLPDARWRVLDMFDAITPAIATTHEPSEITAWFEEAGCLDVRRTAWCATSAVATVDAR